MENPEWLTPKLYRSKLPVELTVPQIRRLMSLLIGDMTDQGLIGNESEFNESAKTFEVLIGALRQLAEE